MQLLKEDIQREYKEKIAKIEEEKAKAIKDSAVVAKEKASIQSLKQELEVEENKYLVNYMVFKLQASIKFP